MLFAIDIGNSSMDFGIFDKNGAMLLKSKISSAAVRSSDEYAVLLSGIMELKGFSPADVDGCIVASVVPLLTQTVKTALATLFSVTPVEVGPGIRTGLDIKIESQSQLGADIVANTAAAVDEFSAPIVIVDVGTATTFTVIDEKGVLQGVIISTGLRMSMNALSNGASELPDVSISLPKRLIGKNTKESMNSGVIYGHAFMIDGFLTKLGMTEQTAVLTGGLAPQVAPLLQTPVVYRPDLTLRGLYILYLKNCK